MSKKNENNQKLLAILAFILTVFVALVFIPIMIRGFSSEKLALASVLLLINGMFGVFDFFKPVYISELSKSGHDLGLIGVFQVAIITLTLVMPTLYMIYYFFLSTQISIKDFTVILGAFFCFILSSGFWATLDVSGEVGTSMLIRSLSNAFVYLAFSLIASFDDSISLPLVLLSSQILALSAFVWFARNRVVLKGGMCLNKFFYKKGFLTLAQNASKLVIDFTDRLFVSRFFPIQIISAYNLSYEIASRCNIPSQVACSFYYPKICKNTNLIGKFLIIGAVTSAFIFICGLLFRLFGREIIELYVGGALPGFFSYFSAMIFIFSIFSLTFFSQAAMRASGQYELLSITFLITALVGSILIYPLYLIMGMHGILLAMLIFKLPGVVGYWKLSHYLGLHKPWIVSLILIEVVTFLFLIFSGIEYAIFSPG